MAQLLGESNDPFNSVTSLSQLNQQASTHTVGVQFIEIAWVGIAANRRPPALCHVGELHDILAQIMSVNAHVKTLCARVCVSDWSKEGCGKSNALKMEEAPIKVRYYALSTLLSTPTTQPAT